MFKYLISSFLIFSLLFSTTGCSVLMALKQPDYKDTQIIKQGTPRTTLIAKYGVPTYTEKTSDGRQVDIFKFKQGYGMGNKIFRALFHFAGDFFTFFLWEFIATPAELVANGHDVKFKVEYDEQDNVADYEFYDK